MMATPRGGARTKTMANSPDPDPQKLLLTAELLHRAKDGDRDALDVLIARYLPRLECWASGRLPPYARALVDTVDLVQESLLRVMQGLERVEVRGPGGFQAYVRQAVLNRIRDEIRWARRRPGPDGVDIALADPGSSPLEDAIGANVLDRYERALDQLPDDARQLLHLRIELDFDYDEIAAMTERPSHDAARMAVRRALTALAEVMGQER
jgi:RNA polymerase sigma-70 factor (ECF subfamily)